MRATNTHRAFTLIELLVSIAVIGVLLSILLPALSAARNSAQTAVCAANLRQIALISWTYADENNGFGPALGQPWGSPPNWALVVQQAALGGGETSADLYRERSVLVCPSADAALPADMTRTYAVNVTGHAGQPGDSGNFDDAARRGHVRFPGILFPSRTAMALDARPTAIVGNAPPPTRAASVIDFRDQAHREQRIGRFHSDRFNFAAFDGSARIMDDVPDAWLDPLP
ncbi:MAG: type II secretion system protein [Planctomycetota bacterium]